MAAERAGGAGEGVVFLLFPASVGRATWAVSRGGSLMGWQSGGKNSATEGVLLSRFPPFFTD
jgi:hypothetical protein